MRSVSVIIPTRNRSDVCAALVRNLLAQEYEHFNITVVDQSDTEPGELTALAKQDARVHFIHLKTPGTCRARNAGIRASKGEIVVFLDDDAVPTGQKFLQAHVDAYGDPEVAGVAGRVLDENDPGAMRGPILTVSAFGAVHPNANASTRQFVEHARGGNMSFRREVLEKTGPFDERFRGNAMREETDYSLRARQYGRILFVPEAEVVHRRHPTGGSRSSTDRIHWYEDFFFNEALFFGKHFPIWMVPILVLRKARPIVACGVYYGRFSRRALTAPWRSMVQGLRVAHQPIP
jgi:GT2 family glycosyltransferase